jgi:hypothetical protein
LKKQMMGMMMILMYSPAGAVHGRHRGESERGIVRAMTLCVVCRVCVLCAYFTEVACVAVVEERRKRAVCQKALEGVAGRAAGVGPEGWRPLRSFAGVKMEETLRLGVVIVEAGAERTMGAEERREMESGVGVGEYEVVVIVCYVQVVVREGRRRRAAEAT